MTWFGLPIALSGGATGDDGAGSLAGAAYVFQHGPGGWEQIAKLVGEKTQTNDWLGWAVALEGDTALVSAPVVLWKQKLRYGAVHVFSIPEHATPYCFGVGCPCGNEDSLRGCENSTGSGGQLAACGTTSVAADDLVLSASLLPGHSFGVLVMGAGSTTSPLGDGRLCIDDGSVGLFRYAVKSSGGAGRIVEGPGIVATSHGLFGPAGQIAAGQTWNFQVFYRDPAGSCGTGLNTTNALAVTFTP